MATYTIGPVQCTGVDPNTGLHEFSGRMILETTPNTTANKTTVNWMFQLFLTRDSYVSHYRYPSGNAVTVGIGSSRFTPSVGEVALGGCYLSTPLTVASGSMTVTHEADGTKRLEVSATYSNASATYMQSITVQGYVDLEPIIRGGKISSAPAMTLSATGTTDHTVAWTANGASYWYKVEYLWKTNVLHTSTVLKTTSYTWSVPPSISEYVDFQDYMTLKVSLHTYTDEACTNEVCVDTKQFRVSFDADFAPEFTYSADIDNDLIPADYRSLFSGTMVQFLSRLSVAFSASAKHGATVSEYTCKVDGVSYTGNPVLTDPVQSPGEITVTVEVTDSRGFKASNTFTRQVTAYSYPRLLPYPGNIEVQVFRCDGVGNPDDTGSYIKIMAASKAAEVLNSGVNVNRAVIKYRYFDGIVWSSYVTVSDVTDAVINDVISGTFPDSVAYSFELLAEDLLGNSSGVLSITVSLADVPLHLREGGHGVGIGEPASSVPDRLMVGYDAFFHKPINTADGGIAISTGYAGLSTMADFYDAVKDTPGGTGTVELSEAFGSMTADAYAYLFIPFDDENGMFYFSLLDQDTGDLWIVHVINDTVCQPFKLTGTR